MPTPHLTLSGFTFEELFSNAGLARLDQAFLDFLRETNLGLHNQLLAFRQPGACWSNLEDSEFLLACALPLEAFLIQLFGIEDEAALLQAQTLSNNPIAAFKKFFVLRQAKKKLVQSDEFPPFSELNQWLESQLKSAPLKSDDKELSIALLANQYLAKPELSSAEIEKLIQWCVQALSTAEGRAEVKNWSSFYIPERMDYGNLVPTVVATDKMASFTLDAAELRERDGFNLTDPRMDARHVQDEVNYCIYCHDHDGDFCSKGFPVKKGDPSQGFKKNPLDTLLAGCPLEEKISEMNLLKRDGYSLASLAMVMVDNPMCPATGHRICNDCMKSCIYQKQEPVNIPQIETRVLTDVLSLPWGVEIYDLLTRWNPLRKHQWIMKPYNGLKVLIAGMGPAGFTLAHHLLLEGFAVVGFDGLKIEPLPENLIKNPIYQFKDLTERLDERLMSGFGGVAEYGITVRWDKNFLKLIYLSLMRRPYFQVFGSVRFGGTLTVEDAWDLGFDHLALAVGAGLPKALPIPGSLATGMRQANDFLMALQLGHAAQASSLTNLQVRLPSVIIGGGLTGVDTATEVQAYYIAQVEKTLNRFEDLMAIYGADHIYSQLDPASREILDEFLLHGKAVRKERQRAAENQQQPNFIKLIREWGGVTIVYRRSMQESPAYINNHEELAKALEEGIYYAPFLEPSSVALNQYGHAESLVCKKRLKTDSGDWETSVEEVRLPARSIFVATGTQPNIAYEFEHRNTFVRSGVQYQHYEEVNDGLAVAHGVEHCKDPQFGPFTSYDKKDFRVSLVGDTHPVFHGSVVKAIASGLRTYPKIVALLKNKISQGDPAEYLAFAKNMQHAFSATVKDIVRRTNNVVEVTIQAPLVSKHFQPGQFFRLQNYETFAKRFGDTLLLMEPLALVGAEHLEAKDAIKFVVIENGVSAKLCSTLQIGEAVSLMGPTGVRCKVASAHETVLLIGNQLSIPLLQSYGTALRAAGNRVLYLGYFKNKEEIYCQSTLENAADSIIWLIENGEVISARSSDYVVYGSDVKETLVRYGQGLVDLTRPHPAISLADVDRIYVIGDSQLLRQLQQARKELFKELLLKAPQMYGSVYSTMQCMLKGVCAQCLQWQIDPETGKRTKAVFACSWPDQPLEFIDTDNIDARQLQNHMQEQLGKLWVDYVFTHYPVKRV